MLQRTPAAVVSGPLAGNEGGARPGAGIHPHNEEGRGADFKSVPPPGAPRLLQVPGLRADAHREDDPAQIGDHPPDLLPEAHTPSLRGYGLRPPPGDLCGGVVRDGGRRGGRIAAAVEQLEAAIKNTDFKEAGT